MFILSYTTIARLMSIIGTVMCFAIRDQEVQDNFLTLAKGEKRHSDSNTKKILCFTPAFVTAHYKLVRED